VEATSAPRPRGLRLPKPRRLLAAVSDERLVDYVRGGDAGAFEVLYDRYSAGILGFCRHMLGSTADAEDAVQHTFIAAHADIQRHNQRDLHVKAWLYTIARNRCLSMLRARREQPSDDGVEIVSDRLVHDVEQRDDLRALLADVEKLPDDQREALVLAEIGDLSHGEISEVLGCEVAKVKSLVFQARTALIDRRIARETPCEEIREQIATLRGGALRRSHLRHHIDACPGCAQFREEVRRQRAMLAIALPVVPSAVLKAHVLGALGIGSGTAAAATGAGAAATAGAGSMSAAAQVGLVAKFGLAAALTVGGIGGAAAVAQNGTLPLLHHSAPAQEVKDAGAHLPGGGASGKAHGTAAAAASGGAARKSTGDAKHTVAGSRRSASGTEHGFTPVIGESNGARARQFAQTRGQGKHTGLTKPHTKGHKRQHPAKKVHVKHTPKAQAAPKARTRALRPSKPAPTPPKAKRTPNTAPAPTTQTTPAPAPPAEQQAPTTVTSETTAPSGTGGSGDKSGKSLSTGEKSAGAKG
jgi:RNA polymerase sigma factor (sigma-70 family)